jgi:hypothetical protein
VCPLREIVPRVAGEVKFIRTFVRNTYPPFATHPILPSFRTKPALDAHSYV